MANRVELNEQDLENVAGGAYRFRVNENGEYQCKVDGIGIFFASESAKRKMNNHWIEGGCVATPEEIVAWAVDEGLLWN